MALNRRHRFSVDQAALKNMVSGHLPHQSGQDGIVVFGPQAPTRRELPDGLGDTPQTDASHD